jgi:hypothetical protein
MSDRELRAKVGKVVYDAAKQFRIYDPGASIDLSRKENAESLRARLDDYSKQLSSNLEKVKPKNVNYTVLTRHVLNSYFNHPRSEVGLALSAGLPKLISSISAVDRKEANKRAALIDVYRHLLSDDKPLVRQVAAFNLEKMHGSLEGVDLKWLSQVVSEQRAVEKDANVKKTLDFAFKKINEHLEKQGNHSFDWDLLLQEP